MSADANDMRHWYSEALIGPSVALACSAVADRIKVESGRHLLMFRSVVGATTLWIKQGGETVEAEANFPSTPFDLAAFTDRPVLIPIIARQGVQHVSAITDAGTVQLVFAKYSRDRK